jgi:hypothetical protein
VLLVSSYNSYKRFYGIIILSLCLEISAEASAHSVQIIAKESRIDNRLIGASDDMASNLCILNYLLLWEDHSLHKD